MQAADVLYSLNTYGLFTGWVMCTATSMSWLNANRGEGIKHPPLGKETSLYSSKTCTIQPLREYVNFLMDVNPSYFGLTGLLCWVSKYGVIQLTIFYRILICSNPIRIFIISRSVPIQIDIVCGKEGLQVGVISEAQRVLCKLIK